MQLIHKFNKNTKVLHFEELFIFAIFTIMKKSIFKIIARINKLILPSFTKKRLDMSKASKIQMAIIGWRYFVTKNSL